MTSTTLPAARSSPSQHILVALALTAISLSAFAVMDYGNNMGIDDWNNFYQAYVLHSPVASNRPLPLIMLVAVAQFLKADYAAYHVLLIAIRAASAFMLYLLVWQMNRSQSLFAFACGAAAAVFTVRDNWGFLTLIYTSDVLLNVAVVLLAINIYGASLELGSVGNRYSFVVLAVSLAFGGLAVLMREGSLPLILGIPMFMTLAKRPFSFRVAEFYAIWFAIIVGLGMRYLFPILGFAPTSYGSNLFQDFDLMRMLAASRNQLEFAFLPVIQIDSQNLYQERLPVILVLIIVLSVFAFLIQRSWRTVDELQHRYAIGYYGVWLLASLAAAWLGFAAFLPTVFASSGIRTHILSGPGEAIALVSAIWFVSHFSQNLQWRLAVRLIGVAWIVIYGVSMTGKLQAELYSYAATWDNTAYFMRSLMHIAPAVKSPTLFVYIENRETEETPFVSGFSFQYAVRYFYDDTATGLVPSDNILGEWSVSDAGIYMQEEWINEPHTFGWGELIVFTREPSGHLVILETLPENFLTAYRQGLYQPYEQVIPAFVSTRIRETFPILSSPDWSGKDYLLQNK